MGGTVGSPTPPKAPPRFGGGRYRGRNSPNKPNCVVKFNFGPDFEFFPQDFGDLPIPQPMGEVPYQALEVKNEGPVENGIAEKTS